LVTSECVQFLKKNTKCQLCLTKYWYLVPPYIYLHSSWCNCGWVPWINSYSNLNQLGDGQNLINPVRLFCQEVDKNGLQNFYARGWYSLNCVRTFHDDCPVRMMIKTIYSSFLVFKAPPPLNDLKLIVRCCVNTSIDFFMLMKSFDMIAKKSIFADHRYFFAGLAKTKKYYSGKIIRFWLQLCQNANGWNEILYLDYFLLNKVTRCEWPIC
jgi:hypothetical protein